MHIHILGICGTFMGGVAILARQMGMTVTGSDSGVYPPMSTQLEAQGITLTQGFSPEQLSPTPDLVVVGNAMSRGNPCVEYILDHNLPYTSGPEFVKNYILKDKWVLAVAGTHGKTTTTSILAWILEYAGLKPGFLVGGIPENFGVSARIGESDFFVIEADEYDTAFFDKRSKFVHYKPRTVILNNLEFDHADIFENLEAIKKQFHHFVRIVPASGLLVHPANDGNLDDVLARGCWTPKASFGLEKNDGWWAKLIKPDGSEFDVYLGDDLQGRVRWSLIGDHNVANALAAIVAARHVGIQPQHAMAGLNEFVNVKRRMEIRGTVNDITVYDDFAHHPTAIKTTLEGLRNKVGKQKIVAVLEPRSNTMRMGVHQQTLADSLSEADEVMLFQPPSLSWDLHSLDASIKPPSCIFSDVEELIQHLVSTTNSGDQVLIMSNGGFENIHQRLLQALAVKAK